MASPKTALLILAAVLLASCCYASRPPRAAGGDTQVKKVTVPMSSDPAKCDWMVPCNGEKCTEHCVRIGLGNERGFCNFHNMQFVCCCPIPFGRTATKIPISSVKHV